MTTDTTDNLRQTAKDNSLKKALNKIGDVENIPSTCAVPSFKTAPVKQTLSAPPPGGFTPEQMAKKNKVSQELIATRQTEDRANIKVQLETHFDERLAAFKADLAAQRAKKAKEKAKAEKAEK